MVSSSFDTRCLNGGRRRGSELGETPRLRAVDEVADLGGGYGVGFHAAIMARRDGKRNPIVMALTGSLCITKLSLWALPGKVISRGFISMSHPNHSSRLAAIVFGVFFGSILGVIAGFALTVWTFQGIGAALGFADDPNWVPFTLLFFCFFGVL